MDRGQQSDAEIRFTKIWDSYVVSRDQIICEKGYTIDDICITRVYNKNLFYRINMAK